MGESQYSTTYTLAIVPDEKGTPFGYIALGAYLLDEIVIDGERKFEVVYTKKLDDLNINNYENLESQFPQFVEGKCTNSVLVDNVYDMFDIAKEAGEEESLKLFKSIAKEECHPIPSFVKDFHDLKRLEESKIAKLSDRLVELNIIERSINNLAKKRY